MNTIIHSLIVPSIPFLISPFIIPAIVLGLAIYFSRNRLSQVTYLRMVRLWPIIRYATLLFWIVIIPIGFAIKPTLRPHDNSSLFTWYIIPAVCFFVSFLPYFYYSTATKIFSGESFTESVPGFNRFLLLNSALSGFLVPIYQVLTAEFMQEAALALVAVIPATFISAVVVCILLHQKVKPRPEPIRSEV